MKRFRQLPRSFVLTLIAVLTGTFLAPSSACACRADGGDSSCCSAEASTTCCDASHPGCYCSPDSTPAAPRCGCAAEALSATPANKFVIEDISAVATDSTGNVSPDATPVSLAIKVPDGLAVKRNILLCRWLE